MKSGKQPRVWVKQVDADGTACVPQSFYRVMVGPTRGFPVLTISEARRLADFARGVLATAAELKGGA